MSEVTIKQKIELKTQFRKVLQGYLSSIRILLV